MTGGVVVGVRLGFDNAATQFRAIVETPHQQGAEQIPGDFRCGTQQEFARERFQGSKAWYHRNAMQGVLVVDKPAGWTSQDVVSKVRGILRTKRAGHAGTLDPDATGVLVVAVGAATRLLPWLDLEPKEYVATVSFGSSTTTEDASGTVTATADASALDWDTLNAAATRFVGEIDQVPPMVSALHHEGKRLHELARAGITVERSPRRIVIHDLQLSDFQPGVTATASLRVVCGGGTYVRTLCADLASAVGLPGHMAVLRRTRVGAFRIEQAVSIADVKPDLVLPVEAVLGHLPQCTVDPDSVARLRHGMDVDAPEGWADCETAVLLADGRLIALAACKGGKLAPFRVFTGDSPA
jgi:tRNA pseudouridine55 synthase